MNYRPLFAFLALLVITLGWLVANTDDAHADQIEPADRTVQRLEVRYVEPKPSRQRPVRAYFELNDGSTYDYANHRRCARDNAVPDRICRTVFWYAR